MKMPSATQWAAWSIAGVAIITAITPELPTGTPSWVRVTLGILGAILLVFTEKAGGSKPPTALPPGGRS